MPSANLVLGTQVDLSSCLMATDGQLPDAQLTMGTFINLKLSSE